MNADRDGLKHRDLTQRIIGMFYEVYNELGMDFWNPSMKTPWLWFKRLIFENSRKQRNSPRMTQINTD